MSDPVKDIGPQILMKIQADIAAFRGSVETRLDRFEDISRKLRRDCAGTLVMMRATAGDFDARVPESEERVAALEGAGRL